MKVECRKAYFIINLLIFNKYVNSFEWTYKDWKINFLFLNDIKHFLIHTITIQHNILYKKNSNSYMPKNY